MSIHFQTQFNCAVLVGSITFSNAMSLKHNGEEFIKKVDSEKIIMDWKEIIRADNVALAILISWLRTAKKYKKQLVFLHLSDSVQNMAKLYGVADIVKQHTQ